MRTTSFPAQAQPLRGPVPKGQWPVLAGTKVAKPQPAGDLVGSAWQVIAFATHELRERSNRARKEAARLHDRLTELTLVQDRDRIAADLGEFIVGGVDLLLGEMEGSPSYIDSRLHAAWNKAELIMDVAPGEPEEFSLGPGGGMHFVVRSEACARPDPAT